MLSLTFLILPICALAAPSSYGTAHAPFVKRYEDAPFAPGSEHGPYELCGGTTDSPVKSTNAAKWSDCKAIQDWAAANDGSWELKRVTDPNDPNDWSVLHRSGNCALVVQNAVATRVGNQDVVNLLDSIKDDANDEGNIEEKGGISECSGDIGVSYWLRDTNGL
ncbi:hypothetical protein F4819DRAFT_322519 [Hypoxylon fuscum]|nr:hypothetical protein F4819DRAFT_322519 [Hypoxylon fuscum]